MVVSLVPQVGPQLIHQVDVQCTGTNVKLLSFVVLQEHPGCGQQLENPGDLSQIGRRQVSPVLEYRPGTITDNLLSPMWVRLSTVQVGPVGHNVPCHHDVVVTIRVVRILSIHCSNTCLYCTYNCRDL